MLAGCVLGLEKLPNNPSKIIDFARF